MSFAGSPNFQTNAKHPTHATLISKKYKICTLVSVSFVYFSLHSGVSPANKHHELLITYKHGKSPTPLLSYVYPDDTLKPPDKFHTAAVKAAPVR